MVSPPQRHPDYLTTAQFSFVDAHGRQIHLRGVNLSGACKAPLDQPSHILKDFWETAEAGGESFIGQPLNLDDGSADEHLARLRGWGFNLLRFPVTWEALEHAGPKKYDYDFMDYTIRVLLKCKQYGFRVYMDPHQDTWSRFSGGSGAPFWTLPACGINPYNLSSTHSALIHSEWPLPHQPDPASFPAMIWGTNYGRLLSLTLFTLFFAGRAFAPKCIIDNMNIQDYLQSHYIAAFGELADRIRRADEEEGAGLRDACIIGWDSLNEPAEGLVEWDDLNVNPTQQGNTLKKGTHPTPAQSLCLGMGKTQTVECWDFGTFGPKRTGKITIDPKGRKIWAEPDTTGDPEGGGGGERPDGTHPRWGWKRDVSQWPLGTCIWALHGVWDVESGFVLRPDYFKYHPATGIEVQFMTDFWLPHFKDYTTRIRQSHPEAILLIQPPVFAMPPRVDEEVLKGRCAYTGHYYDGLTLITKHWNWFNADSLGVLRGRYKSPLQAVKFGEGAIRKSLMEQIGVLKDDAKLISAPSHPSSSEELSPVSRRAHQGRQPNEYPTIIGEIGTPFDMDKKYSYFSSKGDYKNQEKALDASLNACDGYNNVAYTVWTYVPRGHTHEWGDAWNGEDLSLWSPDDLRSTYTPKQSGGNGEQGCCGVGLKNRRRRRRTSGGESTPPQGKNESQAELLGPSLGRFNNKNPSTLTVTSLDTPASGSLEASPTIPSASTPTLLLRKRPSLAFSARTIVEDDRLAVPPSQPVQATTSSSSSTLTTSGGGVPDEDPYDFLTDGARAVRAFCRPRPVKVIGNVVDTKFEISKAEFKCVIRVSPLSSRPQQQQQEREDKEEAATEIYLPMIHFASRELLEGSKARWDPSASQRLKLGLEPSASKVYAAALPQVAGWKDLDDDAPVGSTNAPCESTLLDNIENRDDLLDVDVKVSGGRWKISGQTLYWWYPSPSSEGEEVEFTIEVKRRGGAIKVKKGGWVEVKSWQKSQQRFDGDGTAGKKKWYERLCPCDGSMCVVM